MESCWVMGGGWYCCSVGGNMVCGPLSALLCWNDSVCGEYGALQVV